MRTGAKIILTSLLGMALIFSFGCASESDSEPIVENQIVTVQRGDLIIDITAVGNLELSRKEDLAFDLFYQDGTVEEVLVEEGDIVEEGQLLAKVDISEWQDELTTLERELATKERDLIQKEIDLINAQITLKDAEAKYIWPAEIFTAREAVWQAESELEDARLTLRGDKLVYDRQIGEYRLQEVTTTWEIKYWTQKVSDAEEKLSAARAKLDALLATSAAGTETEEVTVKRLEVELKQGKLGDAQKALEDAQEELGKARSKSPELTAPFDGFITMVNVEGGDAIKTGTVAVQLADPNKFEADLLVSEMDILQVKVGGTAKVQVDAMQGMSLPAKVTHVSPTATIQSGVVNYRVKVAIQSLEPVKQEPQETMQDMMQKIMLGELPEGFQQAVREGRITQEQAEAIVKRFRLAIEEGSMTQEQVEAWIKRGQQAQEAGQTTMNLTEDFQLREGLTVTVSILVEERNDVLLVPNKAITRQGEETFVQVMENGVIEQRSIKTGISDWQYTEVTEGLNEDEEVVISQVNTTPSPQRRPSFFGGR